MNQYQVNIKLKIQEVAYEKERLKDLRNGIIVLNKTKIIREWL